MRARERGVFVSESPRAAVIIPARDAEATLPACLAALSGQGVPGRAADLVVVDDASADATAEIARAAGATVLAGDGRGPAAARNLGAQHAAETDILVFLDADTAPQPGWLEAMLAPFADPEIVGVKGRYVTHQHSLVARFAQLEFEEKYARLRAAPVVDFIDTATAAYRRDAFDEAGGFDESFPAQSAEDVEFAFRLAARGARFVFSDAARVEHAHAESVSAFLYKKARYGFFRVNVYRRYPEKLGGDSYTPGWMAIQILGVALTALSALIGRPSGALGRIGGWVFVTTCWPLLRRSAAADPDLLPWVIPLSYLRALAQGSGLAAGLAALLGRQLARK